MAQTTVDGLRIHYEDMGRGEPALLMTPAWCMSHSGLAQLPARSAAHRRVLTLDWRGHGQSDQPAGDFGAKDLMQDCLAVIQASGVERFIPVTLHHSGWVGIELRRHLGDRVPRLVHLDWVVLPPPPFYMDLLHGLASPDRWQQARDQLLGIFLQNDIHNPDFTRMVQEEMRSYSGEMWMRSGREIGASFAQWDSPLRALASLTPPPPRCTSTASLMTRATWPGNKRSPGRIPGSTSTRWKPSARSPSSRCPTLSQRPLRPS